MPNKIRQRWQRPFTWPPSEWEFTPGLQVASEIFIAIIFFFVLMTILCALIIWPMLIYRTISNIASGSADDVRNTLLAIAALIGIPFLIWRTLIAAKQTVIARESHYTALFTKAIEQLGADKTIKVSARKNVERTTEPHPNKEDQDEHVKHDETVKNFEVRLGAIYALERIAQDSQRDAWPIYQTLCAYIQNNSPRDDYEIDKYNINSSDVAAAINVLSRYKGPRDSNRKFEFRKLHLGALDIMQGAISGIQFSKCEIPRLEIQADVGEVTITECKILDFFLRKNSTRGLHIMSGDYKFIVLSECEITEFTINSIPYGSFISVSNSKLSKFHVIQSSFRMEAVDCEFHDSILCGIDGYNNPTRIKNCTFRDTTFLECDFMFFDFQSNIFDKCKFINCNIIQCKNINGEGNEFEKCFTDNEFIMDSAKDIHTQIQSQWFGWRIINRIR